jgi:hypothetical protein
LYLISFNYSLKQKDIELFSNDFYLPLLTSLVAPTFIIKTLCFGKTKNNELNVKIKSWSLICKFKLKLYPRIRLQQKIGFVTTTDLYMAVKICATN